VCCSVRIDGGILNLEQICRAVAVWCSVLQCVPVCCSVCCSDRIDSGILNLEQMCRAVAVCCSVLQCAEVCCSVV